MHVLSLNVQHARSTTVVVIDYAQHVLLPRFLRLFEDALNAPLKARLLECFGDESWLKEAKNCVGGGTERFVSKAAPWDTYVLAQVLCKHIKKVGARRNARRVRLRRRMRLGSWPWVALGRFYTTLAVQRQRSRCWRPTWH